MRHGWLTAENSAKEDELFWPWSFSCFLGQQETKPIVVSKSSKWSSVHIIMFKTLLTKYNETLI